MERFRKYIETMSNVAILVVAVLLITLLITRTFTQPSAAQPSPQAQPIKSGVSLPAKNIEWAKSDRNLVMVLSTKCHFCADSMEFYKRLTQQNAGNHKLRLIAVLPQDVNESKAYLTEHGVAVDEVIQAGAGEFMASGTPTLILADRQGRVIQSWVGRLPPERESELVNAVVGEAVPRPAA